MVANAQSHESFKIATMNKGQNPDREKIHINYGCLNFSLNGFHIDLIFYFFKITLNPEKIIFIHLNCLFKKSRIFFNFSFQKRKPNTSQNILKRKRSEYNDFFLLIYFNSQSVN